MTIPPQRAPGDIGHIGDHNDIADVLTEQQSDIASNTTSITSHTTGTDPHGDRAYADGAFSPLGHTHTYPVLSVNGLTGAVTLTPGGIGAETPTGAQAKVDALGATVVPLSQKGAADGVATLDSTGKIPSAQLPAGAGVTSVNGQAGVVVLDAADVGAVATTEKGAASGVATLDGSTLVPVAQIPGLNASKITAGTLDIARVPTGTTSTTVSVGDHTHTYPVTSVNSQSGAVVLTAADVSALATATRGAANGVASLDASTKVPSAQLPDLSASYVTTGPNNNPQVANAATTRGWGRVDLNYTATGGTPDAFSFYYGGSGGTGGTRTGYHNEYGELRARPALQATVALRAMGHASGSTGNIFEVANTDMSAVRLGVSESAAALTVPLTATSITASGNVTSANLPPSIGSGTALPDPAGYSEGAVFFVHA